jgi:hypothetical protein
MTRRSLSIEPDGEASLGACPDCGELTRSVWGYVSNTDGARAAYFIRWTDGHLQRGAQIVVSIGPWGKGAQPDQHPLARLSGDRATPLRAT